MQQKHLQKSSFSMQKNYSLICISILIIPQKEKTSPRVLCFLWQDFCKILTFHSTRWLGLSTCIERTLKMCPSLKSYFPSQNPEIKDGKRTVSRLNRLIDAFGNVISEVDVFLYSIFSIHLHHNTNSFTRDFHPVNSYFDSFWPF